MPTVTLQEARATLPDLLHRLMPGEEVTIIEDGRIVGRLLPGESPLVKQLRQPDSMTGSVVDTAPHSSAATGPRPPPGLGKGYVTILSEEDEHLESVAQWPCRAGSAKGKIRIAADFDEPLEDFKEYME